MTLRIHLSNAKGRNATVAYTRLRGAASPSLGVPGISITFKRYLAATESTTHPALAAQLGLDYAKALIEGDPEVDIERVGKTIRDTMTVYVRSDGDLLRAEPSFIDVVLNPDGSERERRKPVDSEPTTNAATPLRWSGRKIPVADAVRRFSFRRTLQLRHTDGLSFDFLFGMARDLSEQQTLMLIGSGDKGVGPLIFQVNGKPFRGFLDGRVDGERYQLLLHLSDLEYKAPAAKTKGDA